MKIKYLKYFLKAEYLIILFSPSIIIYFYSQKEFGYVEFIISLTLVTFVITRLKENESAINKIILDRSRLSAQAIIYRKGFYSQFIADPGSTFIEDFIDIDSELASNMKHKYMRSKFNIFYNREYRIFYRFDFGNNRVFESSIIVNEDQIDSFEKNQYIKIKYLQKKPEVNYPEILL